MVALFCSFLSLYALVTWLPTLMGSQGFTITRSLSFTLAITTAFPISSIVLMVVLDRLGRIRTCVGSFLLAGMAALAFSRSVGDTMLLVTGFVMSFFVVTAANTLDVLCGEMFPTSARSSGSGMGFGAGRLGAVVASYVVLGVLGVYGYRRGLCDDRRHPCDWCREHRDAWRRACRAIAGGRGRHRSG